MTVEPWQSVPDLGMFWWYFPASPLMCCTPLTGPGKKTCNTLFNPMGSGGISKEIFKTLQSESHLFQLGHLLPDFPLGFSKVALLCFYVEGSHLGREVVVLEENENQESRCFHVGDKSWRIQSSRKFYASNFISTLPPSGMLSQHSWTFVHWPTHPPDIFIHFFWLTFQCLILCLFCFLFCKYLHVQCSFCRGRLHLFTCRLVSPLILQNISPPEFEILQFWGWIKSLRRNLHIYRHCCLCRPC